MIATVDSPEMSPEDHVRAVVERSGTSFFWAMRVLPEDKRAAMFAVYAFCRVVDDIADEPGQPEVKRHQLGEWRGEVERLYGGHPRDPVARALLQPVERFSLRKEDFRAVIDGMEMDAGERVRIADIKELELYCDRVACAVGRLSNRVFGLPDDLGDPLAFALGQALQLTNILRDVHEDAGRDRLYLPHDLLRAHDIEDTGDLRRVLDDPAVGDVCAILAEVAQRRFQEAEALIARCDPELVRPAVMMKEVYRRTHRRLMRRGWNRLDKKVRLSKPEKLWVALRYGMVWGG